MPVRLRSWGNGDRPQLCAVSTGAATAADFPFRLIGVLLLLTKLIHDIRIGVGLSIGIGNLPDIGSGRHAVGSLALRKPFQTFIRLRVQIVLHVLQIVYKNSGFARRDGSPRSCW